MSNTARQQEVVNAGVKFYLTDGFNIFHSHLTVNDTILVEVMIGIKTGESHGPLRVDLKLMTEDEVWVSAPKNMTEDEVKDAVRKHAGEIWRMRSTLPETTPEWCESTGTPWSDWR